jgi:homoserine O-acetyltransferase
VTGREERAALPFPEDRLVLASGNVNECHRFARGIGLAVVATLLLSASPGAYDGPVRTQAFTMPADTTVGGRTLKDVRVGYETYGTLNADRTNVILISHHLSGTSHAAGKYLATDQFPGYWDSIIGAGRPIIATDSLVNLNVKDPNTVTTGPASPDPATGTPYGLTFPIVTIRDFVNVQKALVDSLGVKNLHAVIGPAMGVEYAETQGDGGHFDAILGVAQAAETIRTFLGR